MKDCGVSVVHLPRHLRDHHDWTAADARNAVKTFQLRKTYLHNKSSFKQPKYKDYHKARPCPVEGCTSVVKRLSSHLRYHKISQHSPLYKELIVAAKIRSGAVRSGVNSPGSASTNTTVVRTQDKADNDQDGLVNDSDTDDMECDDDDVEPMDEKEQLGGSVTDTEDEKVVKEFFEWMTSADGGRKHLKSAKQHASQMTALIKLTRQNNIALWDRSVLDVFSKYATEKHYLPATKKSYFSSLKHFCDFAVSESKDDANLIGKMKERVSFWIASFRKECGKHQQQKMDTDIGKLVTPQQLFQFKKSEPALSAIKLIGRSFCSDGLQTVVQGEYVNVRDFLLTEIALANANRSGVLANMTLKEFQAARIVDGQYVVSVAEHKTALTYGAAKIVLSPTLHHYVAVYCKHIRSQVVSGTSPNELFLSWFGAGMTSGQITKAVQRIWYKAGLGHDITLNIVRKTAVSSIHQAHPKMTASLADLMCHRQSTAQKCYRLIEREHSSVTASKTLTETLAGVRTMEQTAVAPGEQKSAARLQGLMVPKVEETGTGGSKMAEAAVVTAADNTSYRSVWNETTVSALHDLFTSDITAGNISMDIVRTKIQESDMLMSIGSRKVYDRIRSEIRKTYRNTMTTPLPAECDTADERVARMFSHEKKEMHEEDVVNEDNGSECVAPSTIKDIFAKEDVSQVLKSCAQVIARGPITEVRIHDELTKTARGRKLLEKFTLYQLQNRVKYERRKNAPKVTCKPKCI